MAELKHTPGPWKYDPENDREDLQVRTISGLSVAAIADNRAFPLSQCEANAKLIAAAPDMLNDLLRIDGISPVDGRDGTTWGDTEYDSRSVAYGYNLALEHIRRYLTSIEKATK